MCKVWMINDVQNILKTHNETVFLQNLLCEKNLTAETAEAILTKCGIHLKKRKFRAAILELDHPYAADASLENRKMLLSSFLNQLAPAYGCMPLVAFLTETSVVSLLFGQTDGNELFYRLKHKFLNVTGCTLSIGVSVPFSEIVDIPKAIRQAKSALSQKAYYGGGTVVTYQNKRQLGKGGAPILFSENLYDLCGLIREQKSDEAIRIVEQYFDSVSKSKENIGNVKELIYLLALMITHDRCLAQAASNAFQDDTTLTESFKACETCKELREWIIRLIQITARYVDMFAVDHYSANIKKAILFTMQNYAKPITVGMIADELGVSANHFMRLFKKETGKTYGAYLTEYRIVQAKKLLLTGKYKVYEVGEMVGYTNPIYFNKVFRNYMGHNPGYYIGKGAGCPARAGNG